MCAFWQCTILGECAADDGNVDWFEFVVGEIDQSLRGATIDKLHAEDLSFWESYGDGDCEIRSLSLDILLGRLRSVVRKSMLVGGWELLTESCGAAKTLVARRAKRARAEYLRNPIVSINWDEGERVDVGGDLEMAIRMTMVLLGSWVWCCDLS